MAESDPDLIESGWTLLNSYTSPDETSLSMESFRSTDLFGAGSSSEELPYSRTTVKLRCVESSTPGEYQEYELKLEESQALVVQYAASMPAKSTTLLQQKLNESFMDAAKVNITDQSCIIVSLEQDTIKEADDFKKEVTRIIESLSSELIVKPVAITDDKYTIKHLTHHLKDHPSCRMYKTETGNSIAFVVQSKCVDDIVLVDEHIKVVTSAKVVTQDLCLNDENAMKLDVLLENNRISFLGTDVDLINGKLTVTGYEEDVQTSLHTVTKNIKTHVSISRKLSNYTLALLESKAYVEWINTFIQRKGWKVIWKVSAKIVIVVGKNKKQVELTTDLVGSCLVTISDDIDLHLYRALWDKHPAAGTDAPVTVIKVKSALKERMINMIKETRPTESTLFGPRIGMQWNFFLKKYVMEIVEHHEGLTFMSDIHDKYEVVLNGSDKEIGILEKKLQDIQFEVAWIGKEQYVPILKTFTGITQKPEHIQIFEAVSVKIESGFIEKQKVDIIVNSAGPNLNVGIVGTVTTAVLEAAGEEATSSLSDYPKPVPVGNVVIGAPGKLSCKKIMHAVLAKYNLDKKDECIKQLKDVVEYCLSMTIDKGYKSIAFPALCAGVYSYPIDIVAETMLDAIIKIVNTRGRGLESVRIVCFQKDKKRVFDDIVARRLQAVTKHDKCLIKEVEWPTSHYCCIAAETKGEIEKLNKEIQQAVLDKDAVQPVHSLTLCTDYGSLIW